MLGFVSILYRGRRVLRTIMRGFLVLVRDIDRERGRSDLLIRLA